MFSASASLCVTWGHTRMEERRDSDLPLLSCSRFSPLLQGIQTQFLRSGTAESAAQKPSLCLQVHLAAWIPFPCIGLLKEEPYNIHALAVLWKILSIKDFIS